MSASQQPDWHLKEWAAYRGKKQADMVKDLGWPKNQAFRLWHGTQPYKRDVVNALSGWLQIKPYELLMTPAEALALRQLRATAALIMAEDSVPFDGPKS